MFGRKKIAILVAEFLGTALLTLVVLSVSKMTGYPFFVAAGAGLVVAGMTLSLGSISGAHLNPAITIGLWSARQIKALTAVTYIAVQLLAGITAYLAFSYFLNKEFQNVGTFDGRTLMAESIGAFVFSLGWAAALYQKLEPGKSAAVIGISLMLGILVALLASRGFINPAVALGARSWVLGTYVLGPILGAVIGFNLYALLFAPPKSLLENKDKAKS